MRELTKEDKLFFFERHFGTLDGLWMIVTEEEINWDIALKVDLEVWIKALQIFIRRLKEYLEIKSNTLRDLIEILTFRWSIEGWAYEISHFSSTAVVVKVHKCPYKSAMDRNPERQDRIPLICKDMCIPFYKKIIEEFNPEIHVNRLKYMGLGDTICDFHFEYKPDKSHQSPISEEFQLKKKEISIDDKLFYFEKNFKTLDGLWIIELEKLTNWETALKVDIIVWQKLYEIIFRRIKQYLNINENGVKELKELLNFIWSCEGYEYTSVKESDDELIIQIIKCPYLDAMLRNPERHKRIEAICKDMCIPFYEPALKQFNPNIILERSKFLGVGDQVCDFHFKIIY